VCEQGHKWVADDSYFYEIEERDGI